MTWPYNQRVNSLCEECKIKPAIHKHHLLSNTKRNKSVYGKLIDHPLNCLFLCYDCHLQKSVKKYTESEFRNIMLLNGIELPELNKPVGLCRRGVA